MNHDRFASLLKVQFEETKRILGSKGQEYSEDGDRLSNFKMAAELQGVSTVVALAGMMAKHTVSVYDMIQTDPLSHSESQWLEKINDHINYLILLRAVLTEYWDQGAEAAYPIAQWEKELLP